MRIYSWNSEKGNFGDDLNQFLWYDLEPDIFSHVDEDITFFGVGTILWEGSPKTRVRLVMGSGIGYGRLPADLTDSGWCFYAVRGPLTARAVNRDESLAVTDPAILLPTLLGYRPSDQSGTIFIPHWTTAENGYWLEPCKLAGIDYVDPRADPKEVIRRIFSARLVIAESMHDAIIADAFRVPWSAVVCDHYSPLKWHDWALSLELEYQPYYLGSLSSSSKVLANMLQRRRSNPEIYRSTAEAEFRSFLLRTGSAKSGKHKQNTRRLIRSALNRAADVLIPNGRVPEHGAELLHAVSKQDAQLSGDSIVAQKQEILLEQIKRLVRDYRAGLFRSTNLVRED